MVLSTWNKVLRAAPQVVRGFSDEKYLENFLAVLS